jgi:hypothetical protein
VFTRAGEGEPMPTSWHDFAASAIHSRADPGLNSNEVPVTTTSRGNYATPSRGNKKTLHLVMYWQNDRAKVRL